MKTILFFSLIFELLFANAAFSGQCLTINGENSCEGDRVFYPFSKDPAAYFGTITRIEQPDPAQRMTTWGNRTVTFSDGSSQDDSKGYHSYYPASSVSDCGVFNGKSFCKGNTVLVENLSDSEIRLLKVIGIARDPFMSYPTLYGEVLEGEKAGTAMHSHIIVLSEGPVPGFEGKTLGREIPNGYGSTDMIKYFVTASYDSHPYRVYLGDIKKTRSMSKAQLDFRLSNKKETTISLSGQQTDTLKRYSKAKAIEALSLYPEAALMFQCEANYFTPETAVLKNVKFEYKNLTHELQFHKTVGGACISFDVPILNPLHRVTADYTITATCAHK